MEIKHTNFKAIQESDIEEMKTGELIFCEGQVPKKIRLFIVDQDPKNFIIQKTSNPDNFWILRTDNKKQSSASFKKLKTGEFVDFKDDRAKMQRYAHCYGKSSNKKFKTETFNLPDQGKFTRITRIS
jgi:hypothetical protein